MLDIADIIIRDPHMFSVFRYSPELLYVPTGRIYFLFSSDATTTAASH